MSIIESIVWHVLGYTMIPFIFLAGFLVAAVVGCFLLELAGRGGDQ